MDSMILELQKDIINSNLSISTILRKALLIANKLELEDFKKWIEAELNGYAETDVEVPAYRRVYGKIQAHNPYRGWIPVIIEDTEILESLNNRKMQDAITYIEELVSNKESDSLVFIYPNGIRKILSQATGFNTDFQLTFNKSQAKGVIESVRNILLKWSLKLEKEGIKGNGISFSLEEVAIAQKENITHNHFYGNITNSQFQQNSNNSKQKINLANESFDITPLKELLKLIIENKVGVKLEEQNQEIINQKIKNLDTLLSSPTPDTVKIKSHFIDIKNIFEGISGSLIASGIVYQIGAMFA